MFECPARRTPFSNGFIRSKSLIFLFLFYFILLQFSINYNNFLLPTFACDWLQPQTQWRHVVTHPGRLLSKMSNLSVKTVNAAAKVWVIRFKWKRGKRRKSGKQSRSPCSQGQRLIIRGGRFLLNVPG